MSATHDYQPPAETEATGFFQSLPSWPKLVARTNSDIQPYQCLFRLLTPISDDSIIAAWGASVRQGLLNILSGSKAQITWNAFMPLRIHGRPYLRQPFSPSGAEAEEGNFLLIAVEAGSTTWRHGLEAALACRNVLYQNGIHNMEVAVVEMSLIPMMQPEQTSSPCKGGSSSASDMGSPAKTSPPPPQELFDAKFSRDDQPTISQAARVNEFLIPILPFPGQCLQPVDTNAKGSTGDRPCGSLTVFLQLEDENGTVILPHLALCSRHVAVQDTSKNPTLSKGSHSGKAGTDLIPIAWGSNKLFESQLGEIKISRDNFPRVIVDYRKRILRGDPSDKDIAQLRNIEECSYSYIPNILESLETLHSECNPGSMQRRVGNVIAASSDGLNKDGAWSDWALITVGNDKCEKNSTFRSNYVYIGDWARAMLHRVNKLSSPNRVMFDLQFSLDDYGFLKLVTPHPPMQTVNRAAPRLVLKRGPVSGLTVGLLSPVEAIIRRPRSGTDVVAWAWPVLSLPGQNDIDSNLASFTMPGDSGSCVFDETGIVLGVVDAGLGNDKSSNRLFMHHGGEGSTAPVPVPEMVAPRESHEHLLPGFMPWTTAVDFSDGLHTVDITLMTPIDWVLSDIKDTTGLIPRIL